MMRRPSTSPAAKRKAAERARKRASGLVSVEYWIFPEYRQRLDRFVDKLRREAEMLA